MIFTETNESNKVHLHCMLFVFAAYKAFFYKISWERNEAGDVSFSFWYMLKATNQKIRLWN